MPETTFSERQTKIVKLIFWSCGSLAKEFGFLTKVLCRKEMKILKLIFLGLYCLARNFLEGGISELQFLVNKFYEVIVLEINL